MLNEAMRIERSQALDTDPYQRTQNRRGYTNWVQAENGFHTRIGDLALQVPRLTKSTF